MSESTALFEPINLDDLCTEVESYREAARVLHRLGHYARVKARACEHRMSGRIEAASLHEAEAERIYQRLPKWARW